MIEGKRAVVWGFGRHGGGAAVTQYLLDQGAAVQVVDLASPVELGEPAAQIDKQANVRCHWNSPLAAVDLSKVDLLVTNPAIPANCADWQNVANAPHLEVTSEIGLIGRELDARNSRVIAITGSNGKSSVCQWIARTLARKTNPGGVYLGGNFELNVCREHTSHLLSRIHEIDAQSTVILELSSFQLAHLHPREPLRLACAAITNVSPNHLDWHGSFDQYLAAKTKLVERANASQCPLVLPSDRSDPIWSAIADFQTEISARIVPSEPRDPASWPIADQLNAGIVAAILEALGCTVSDEELTQTRPNVEHRRQIVGVHKGITFIDDSAATTPEAVQALLAAYRPIEESPSALVVIAGGRNKGASLSHFGRQLAKSCNAVATIGEVRSELAKQVAIHGCKVRSHATLAKAVRWALKIVPSGGVVALSPGMASSDMFDDYRDRARAFRQLLPISSAEKATASEFDPTSE